MIKIKLDKKQVEVPTFNELTVKQYREILPYIANSGGLDILRYISITTGVDYRKSLHFKVHGLGRLQQMMGTFRFIKGDSEPVNDLSYIENNSPKLLMKVRGKFYDFSKFKPKAVGFRILLEEFYKTKPNIIDLYLFMAASMFTETFDYSEVLELKGEFEDYGAFKILSFGSFFLHKWKRQEFKESILSRLLKRAILTNTRLKNHKLVLTDFRNINLLKR